MASHSQSSGVDNDYLFKVIIIGDANVGKSSLISQFCNEKFMDTVASTVGVDFYIKEFKINGKNVKVSWVFESFIVCSYCRRRGEHSLCPPQQF